MSRALTALHLCAGTDAAKTALALREAGVRAILVNTSHRMRMDELDVWPVHFPVASNLYERSLNRYTGAARYAFNWLGALGEPALRWTGASARLAAAVEAAGGVDFIFAHWGSGILPEVALLKGARAYAHLPVILNFETYPTGTGGARERFEAALLRRAASRIAGWIAPSAAMAELVVRAAPAFRDKPSWIAPFYFPRSFTAAAGPPAIPAQPGDDVVFSGWMNLASPVNDVRAQLLELARAGLVVHVSPTPGLEHENIRVFARFPAKAFSSGELATFMRRFRASLVTFNTGESDLLRFQSSLPTRLLFSLAVGVPVLIPRGRMPASERLVEEHDVGLVYGDPAEARMRLLAPSWTEVQARAFARRDRFHFEPTAFLALVERVLAR